MPDEPASPIPPEVPDVPLDPDVPDVPEDPATLPERLTCQLL